MTDAKEKLLSPQALYEAIAGAGIASRSYARIWCRLQEEKGLIAWPKSSKYQRRKFSQRQIKEIVDAFVPGGNQAWTWPGNQ